MEGLAQKLSPPQSFEFWKRKSHSSVNFEARNMFKVPKFSKKYSQSLVFYHFLLSLERFLYNLRKRDIAFVVSPSCWSFWPSWGGYWEHNIAFSQIVKKPLKLEQKVMKYQKLEIFFAKFWHLKHSSSFKIDRVTAIYSSKLKWAGQA